MISKPTWFILFIITFAYFSFLQFFADKGPQTVEDKPNKTPKAKPQVFQKVQQQQQKQQQSCSSDMPQRTVVFDYSYIRKEHKEHLVRDYFDEKCDWNVKSLNNVIHYHMIWVFNPRDIDYSRYEEGQHMANHIENLHMIVDKAEMVNTLRAYDNKQLQKSFISQDFIPLTYILNFKTHIYSPEETQFVQSNPQGIWILKPTYLFGGKGIQMINDPQTLVKTFQKSKQNAPHPKLQKYVVQKYIENPLLIDKKKFDIRCYVMIPCNAPYFVLYHHGFIRRTLQEYTLNAHQIQDMHVHLTNIEAQKKHPDYQRLKNSTQMSMQQFDQYLINQLGFTQIQLDKIYTEIKKICTYTVLAAKDVLVSRQGYFQILGFDFMLDENLKVYLIEVNKSPSWQIVHPDQQFKKKMLFSFIDMVLKINDNYDKVQDLLKNYKKEFDLSSGYQLLVNDALNYDYLQEFAKFEVKDKVEF